MIGSSTLFMTQILQYPMVRTIEWGEISIVGNGFTWHWFWHFMPRKRYLAAIPIPVRPLDVPAYRRGETVASSKRKLRHSLRATFALLLSQLAASPWPNG